ncbi:MAG: DUF4147 domain-containing protein [Chloroflexota bacterium]|nr:DUF4147 domain-containing protein [Chloroflexota bacterium]
MVDLSDPGVRRSLVERAYAAGVARVAPDEAIRRVMRRDGATLVVDGERIRVPGRLVVVAIGKAATPMAAATAETAGDLIDQGLVLTKDGHAEWPPAGFEIFEASHPVPDERGIEASRRILKAANGLSADDVVVALISGGGSALFEVPAGDLTLDDIQQTTSILLRAGAPIQDLNAVRQELSRVKGGGFRRTIGEARMISLILSDVLGNPPEIIASGPTILRDPNPKAALDVLDLYGVRSAIPSAVVRHLERTGDRPQAPQAGECDLYCVVGDNEAFVAAVEDFLTSEGLNTERVWREREGEAREQAREWVEAMERAEAQVVLGGGEMTVTVRGDGIGGRNTEFALAAGMELEARGLTGTVASLGSDGQDGTIDAAGGIVDEGTIRELRQADLDPVDAMDRSDSGGALAAIGALLVPGPTGTNVNDVYIGLRL